MSWGVMGKAKGFHKRQPKPYWKFIVFGGPVGALRVVGSPEWLVSLPNRTPGAVPPPPRPARPGVRARPPGAARPHNPCAAKVLLLQGQVVAGEVPCGLCFAGFLWGAAGWWAGGRRACGMGGWAMGGIGKDG